MNQSLEKIKEILESRQLSDFVGFKEDIYFEAKGKIAYDLDSAKGRYELAKDVSALANAEGGYLIIGLETVPLFKENTDRVKALDLLLEREFDSQKYKGILNENIYPKIPHLEVKWIENNENKAAPQLGIGYVYVPSQHQDKKYFLIKNVIDEDEPIRKIIFGIAERKGSSNHPLTIKKLHNTIKHGMGTTAQKLTRIEEKVDLLLHLHISPISPIEESPTENLAQRISDAVNSED